MEAEAWGSGGKRKQRTGIFHLPVAAWVIFLEVFTRDAEESGVETDFSLHYENLVRCGICCTNLFGSDSNCEDVNLTQKSEPNTALSLRLERDRTEKPTITRF
jgi:hypothetical protein